MQWLNLNQGASQQLLYPQTVKFSPIDTEVIKEILHEIRILGFDINEFGKNTFIVEGVPAGLEIKDTNAFLENLIENYKTRHTDIAMDKKTHVALSMAKQASIGTGRGLTQEEMNNLIDKLFSCSTPDITPDGLPTYFIVSTEEMGKRFKKI
jgi:DNA mismatch repair protein MutL